ncbi:MAG: TOTE conflict system archaeo-eukaryotic primase domain-containing protein, partial [Terriglobales bacterium]
MAEEFVSLFHRYAYIYKPLNGGSWLSADDRWKLTDTEILKACALAHPKYLLGCRSGKTTRFAILDIDAGSPYHRQDRLHQLIELLMESGLTEPAVYRSSDSDGWHIYMFFEQEVPSRELQLLLDQLLRANGFSIQKGKLEIFPNRGINNVGYGVRLPLQRDFAWLNSQTLEVETEREWLSPADALKRFMSDAHHFSSSPQQYEQFKRSVAEYKEAFAQIDEQLTRATVISPRAREATTEIAFSAVAGIFKCPPPGIDCEVWYRGRTYFDHGLNGPSQRADALFCLGHYLFYGDPVRGLEALGYGYEEERRHAIESILALKNNGQSKDISRGRHDAMAQVARAARWRPSHKRTQETQRYKKGTPIAWIRHNANLKQDSMTRIKAAMDKLIAEAKPFTVKELQERSGVKSLETLYAHKALWHAIYVQMKTWSADITDEYNAVVGAAAPQSGTPPQDYAQDMPVGRLAARAVVARLSESAKESVKAKRNDIHWLLTAYES